MRKACDLVMKGGVTSGVVYPPAIVEIAHTFDLHGIGGTSAGAIAAALAAAAQYRRFADLADPEAGYAALGEVPAWLGSEHHLFDLFAPNVQTRRLFDTVVSIAAPGRPLPERIRDLIKAYGGAAALGTLPGSLHMLAANRIGDPTWRGLGRIAAALSFLAGAVAAPGIALGYDAMRRLPANFYGLVTGIDDAADNPNALCTWLAATTERLAGLTPGEIPLTFGMLWNPAAGAVTFGDDALPNDAAIDLKMMTTSIVENRPYLFPTSTRHFWFAERELEKFFPAHVIRWLIVNARAEPLALLAADGTRLVPLPPVADLPILVATRMSLAFPLLLSAVPFYTRDVRGEGAAKGRRVLFSDGGISSNFPIALFDSPLPRHPTLGINLGSFPQPQTATTPDVVMSDDGTYSEIYPTNPVSSALSFLAAIFGTMQNWSDATLARLPAYRDRIVTVRLTSAEGGLNLDMDAPTIASLVDRGRRAGAMLVARFGPPSRLQPVPADARPSWETHRWIRFRTILGELRDLLSDYCDSCTGPEDDDVTYHELVLSAAPDTVPQRLSPLPADAAARDLVARLSAEIAVLGKALATTDAVEHDIPLPAAALVTRAQLDQR